jgi:hypothetical protein
LQKDHVVYKEAPDTLSNTAPDGAPPHTVENSVGDWSSKHWVNVRLSVPLLFGRYYVTIVAGPERRSYERLKSEKYRHPLLTFGNLIAYFIFGSVVGLACLSLIQFLSYLVIK